MILNSCITYIRPIIPLIISFIIGIVLGNLLPGYRVYGIIISFICIIFLFYIIKIKKYATISPVYLFISLGYLSVQPWTSQNFPSNHISHFINPSCYMQITGTLYSQPVIFSDIKRQKFVLNVKNILKDGSIISVVGKLQVTISGKHIPLYPGDKISYVGKIRMIKNFSNPGGFDYKKYMAFNDIYASSYTTSEKILLVEKISKDKFYYIIGNLKESISNIIENLKNKKEQAILKALIIGDTSFINSDLRDLFNRAGISHVLSISGLHVGIIAIITIFIFQHIFSYSTFFLWNAWTKKGAILLSMIPVWFYGILSGMSPPTQRTCLTITIILAALLFNKQHNPINTLAHCAILILIIHPPYLYSISFQLSFVAVISILYGTLKAEYLLSKFNKRYIKHLFLSLYLSIFALLGTIPLSMYYFNQISLAGIIGNLIAVPIIAFGVVPFGLLAVFIYFISISASKILIDLSAFMLKPALYIINIIANFQNSVFTTITPNILEIFLFYIIIGTGYNIMFSFKKHNNDLGLKISFYILILSFLILLADIAYFYHQRFFNDDLRITYLDVGQGNCALLELPKGYCILIDGGGFADNSVFDIGEKVVSKYLWKKKIKSIDAIILTHADSDHLHGLLYIIKHFKIGSIWTNGESASTISYDNFLDIIKRKNIPNPKFNELKRDIIINNVEIKILYPPENFLVKKKNEKWRNDNNNSLVIKVSYGTKSFLFPGDITAKAEKELSELSKEELRSTVLLAPHHGSKTSNSQIFLDYVKPKIVIISVGLGNYFNFPEFSVLQSYVKRECQIFRTDQNGAIFLRTDGKMMSIESCH